METQASLEKLKAKVEKSHVEMTALETERELAIVASKQSLMQLAESGKKREILETLSKKLHDQRNEALAQAEDFKSQIRILQQALSHAKPSAADSTTGQEGKLPEVNQQQG